MNMHQLEVFQYAKSLDLNIGYYNISIYPASQYMTTVVTDFGELRYTRLPMGMCALGDIFQAKLDELLGDIEGVNAYIDDIPVLNKYSFKNHIEQLRIIFNRLKSAGLKVNAPKCSFGLK